MAAYNNAGHLSLSARFLGGAGESQEGQGWREYLLSEMSDVTVLPQTFAGPHPGYRPDGGKRFNNLHLYAG
jgi:hypothetical protein